MLIRNTNEKMGTSPDVQSSGKQHSVPGVYATPAEMSRETHIGPELQARILQGNSYE